MLLAASAMPTIQVVVSGQLIRPLSPPQIHQTETSTAIGRAELIKHTKSQILPDPYSSELSEENENLATRVLAAAVFLKKFTLMTLHPGWMLLDCFIAKSPS